MSNKDNMLSSKELVLEVENIFIQSGFIISSFLDLKNGFVLVTQEEPLLCYLLLQALMENVF